MGNNIFGDSKKEEYSEYYSSTRDECWQCSVEKSGDVHCDSKDCNHYRNELVDELSFQEEYGNCYKMNVHTGDIQRKYDVRVSENNYQIPIYGGKPKPRYRHDLSEYSDNESLQNSRYSSEGETVSTEDIMRLQAKMNNNSDSMDSFNTSDHKMALLNRLGNEAGRELENMTSDSHENMNPKYH